MTREHAIARESLLVEKGERLNMLNRQCEREVTHLWHAPEEIPQREALFAARRADVERDYAGRLAKLDADFTRND